MRPTLVLAACFVATTGAAIAQSKSSDFRPMRKPPAIGKVTPSATKVGQYEKLELRVDLAATYDNPFDPDEVRLDAVFRAPSGAELTVPGFFMLPERRTIEGGRETMAPEGEGFWAIRFAPAETGRYAWRLKLKDRSGEISGGEGSFEAVAGTNPGFVRKSKADPHYLAFDNGQGFFPIGHNLPIYHTTRPARRRGDAQVRRRRGELQPLVDVLLRLRHRVDGQARLVPAGRGRPDRPRARPGPAARPVLHDVHGHAPGLPRAGLAAQPVQRRQRRPVQDARRVVHQRDGQAVLQEAPPLHGGPLGLQPARPLLGVRQRVRGLGQLAPMQIKLPWHREMSDHLALDRPLPPPDHHELLEQHRPGGVLGAARTSTSSRPTATPTTTATWPSRCAATACTSGSGYAKPHVFGEFGIRSHTHHGRQGPAGLGDPQRAVGRACSASAPAARCPGGTRTTSTR